MGDFEQELCSLIDRYGKGKDTSTPDFILAHYILDAMVAFNSATGLRDAWFNQAKKAVEGGRQ